jgi:putative ABC transport system permease protein
MFKNYFITSLRNFIRQRLYSFINIGGLAIGIAVCILILMWVNDELSYDKFNINFDNIHRVVENQYYAGGEVFPVAVTPTPLSANLVNNYPEILKSTRTAGWGNNITHNGEIYEEGGFWYADSSFFEIFTFPFLKGDPQTALNNPHTVVLTQSMAEKYFGEENPIGKTLEGINKIEFVVTGVIEDVPENSHMYFDFIACFDFLEEWGVGMDNWGSNTIYTYVLLDEKANYLEVSDKIKNVIKDNNEGSVTDLFLQPLSELHLYNAGIFTADNAKVGDIQYVRIFSIIAIFILLIACINFMNLATAKSVKRAREVGLRKVVGANRLQIIKQFFSESFFLVLLSLVISVVLVEIVVPYFNELSSKELEFSLFSKQVFLGILGILFITSFLSGSYPALFMSGFMPIKVLKGGLVSGIKGAMFRKILVLIQFSISIFLIIGTIAINKQLDFIQDKKLGYDKENLVYFNIRGIENEKRPIFKTELLRNPGVISVAYSQQTPTYMGNSSSGWNWEGKETEEEVLLHHNSIGFDFKKTFGMEMAYGRFFSREYPTDSANGIIINEAAVKVMRFDDPIGKNVYTSNDTLKVIGVVKDFHFKPIHTKIEPMVLYFSEDNSYNIFVRIDGNNIDEIITQIEQKFKEFAPGSAFSHQFLDQRLANMYETEKQAKSIFGYFSILAILIACLGLFGLASFASEQRTKEIGIRKAMGASMEGLTILLSKDFTKYVLIANVIAWPLAYFVLENWLNNFAYHIDISIFYFITAAVISFIVAILTVGYHAIRASLLSPIDSLRYE